MLGQTVGKYRVVSRLGRGGMGTVYKAVDETLDREVAIKCLNPDLSDVEVLKRFRAEAITLARLNHPNIATLFELTEHDGELLMVMEFVRGETFEIISHKYGPLPVERAAQLCSQILDALGHAHRAGVVHRDLKPANLMLTDSGLTKVMDFGLARMAGTEHLTNDGFMVGTPAYMAPEQVLGKDIDGRADLYAMGVVLFRLLTAQLPFKAESGIAMVQKQLHDQPTPVRQLRTELPLACDEIIGRALAKSARDRFQTAEDFRAALVALGAPASGIGASPSTSVQMPAVARAPEPTLPFTPSPALAQMSLPISSPALVSVPVPVPVPVAVAALSEEESVPTLVIPAPRRANIALTAAVGAVLLAGVPTAIVVWRGHVANTGGVPPASAPAAPSDPSAAVAAPATPPPVPAVAESTAPAARGPVVPAARKAEAPAGTSDAVSAKAAPAGTTVPSILPIVTFGNTRLLVIDGGKSRDRETSLRLGADGLDVLENGTTIQSVSYRDITGMFHSHSREPRWTPPDGKSVPVAKPGGRFNFLKGVPDWITVKTRQAFIPLRVADEDLTRVIAELETRTGTRIVRTR